MASIIARCVPGSYDTLEDAAKGLAHATLACALLGTVGFLGTGYCAGIVAMQCLVLSAMANRNASLLKYVAASTWYTIWVDIAFLGVYFNELIDKEKYAGREYRGNQLACGMVVLIVLLRIPSFFIWQKLWDLGFRTSSGGNARYVDYNTNPVARQQEMGAAPTSAGAGAFSQPPRATPPAPRPAPPAPVSAPAPVSPAPFSAPAPVSAPAPPAPITSPAVVSFTPSSPAPGPSPTYQ